MDIITEKIIHYILAFILGVTTTYFILKQLNKCKIEKPKEELNSIPETKYEPKPSIPQRILKYEQIDLNGFTQYRDIQEFDSLRKAEQATSFKRYSIRKCCDELSEIKKDGKVIVFRYVK